MSTYVGVDGGGTKIEIAVQEGTGVPRLITVPGANIEKTGPELAWDHIRDGLRSLRVSSIEGACFSMCGVDFSDDERVVRRVFSEGLKRDFNSDASIIVENDAFAGLRAGVPKGPAFVLSLGTGFTAGAISHDGRPHLVCDYELRNLFSAMLLAIANACHQLSNGRVLLSSVYSILKTSHPEEILARICYTPFRSTTSPLSLDEKMALLRRCFSLYEQGEPATVRLFEHYVERMSACLLELRRRVGEQGTLVFSGRFFSDYKDESYYFRERILMQSAWTAPSLVLHDRPALGALAAARSLSE